jgi:hypothetical protein
LHLLVFHAYIYEMHGWRSKNSSKNLIRQRFAEGFHFGVKGLMCLYSHIQNKIKMYQELWCSYVFFWDVPQRMKFSCHRFGSLCLFHLLRQVSTKCDGAVTLRTHSPMKMEQTECSETVATKRHTPENIPKNNIRHSKQGQNLK